MEPAPEVLRPDFSLPCKLITCLHLHEVQMLEHYKLRWPQYKCLHKRQNVRASEACPPGSKETSQATLHHLPAAGRSSSDGICISSQWYHVHTAHTASTLQPAPKKALPEAKPAQRRCDWKQCQEYVTKGWWGSHALLGHSSALDRQNCLKDSMLFTISLRLSSFPG